MKNYLVTWLKNGFVGQTIVPAINSFCAQYDSGEYIPEGAKILSVSEKKGAY